VIIFMLYTVLPSTATCIFNVLNCRNIDPENLVPGLPRYLKVDYAVSCAEPRYKVAQAFASLMVVVYPIGVLMLFYFMLWYVTPSPRGYQRVVPRCCVLA